MALSHADAVINFFSDVYIEHSKRMLLSSGAKQNTEYERKRERRGTFLFMICVIEQYYSERKAKEAVWLCSSALN